MNINENEKYLYINIYNVTVKKVHIPFINRKGDFLLLRTDGSIGYNLIMSKAFYDKESKKNPKYIEVGVYTYLVKDDFRDAFLGIRAMYKEKISRVQKNFIHSSNMVAAHIELYRKIITELKKLYEDR